MNIHNEFELVDTMSAKGIDVAIDVEYGTIDDGITIFIDGKEVIVVVRQDDKTHIDVVQDDNIELGSI